ncbi:anthranilate synthase component 1 [Thalassotalea sp. M1531]|uniref:Anthranilate synthase component 1 n=1 Tax=Thalassotalea algicola TaxID=2716224 RepID=A0A7Y0Q9R7_9GAMM|nr:anthranilate synthase component 1 [Thalassotalea algicola]NMP33485.1 anthranilate synthase component 1 [Thalassotalea algicola]
MRVDINKEIGAVNTLSGNANYQSDPLAVYQRLCQHKPNSVLLESAEIDKKHELKSLLVTDSAVKITCNGNQVTFKALSLNGEAALTYVAEQLASKAQLVTSKDGITATFNSVNINLDEVSRLKASNSFDALRAFKQITNNDHHDFAIFLAGCFAFDMMSVAEQLPHVNDGENTCPDYVFYLAETIVVVDHEKRSSEIIGNVFSGPEQQKCYFEISRRLSEIKQLLATPISISAKNENKQTSPAPSVNVDIEDEQFCQNVEALKEHIRAGDIFQVVPSRTFSLPCPNPIAAYQALKRTNPSPYMFFMQDDDFCIFGASPESALKYQTSNNQVELYPIAGTRPRGKINGELSPDLDSRIELELRQDQKELAEHIMLVDLARNDIARVSIPGTRHVAELLKVDRYSHVMHLVSRVCGQLKPDLDALHAYQACMNMGTLSGAPKVKATELIRQFEGKRRGSYGGAVGYMTGEGEMDTCIVIRSAFVKNETAHVQAGAGVVYDSDPQAEANETRQKAQAVLNAIAIAEQGEA